MDIQKAYHIIIVIQMFGNREGYGSKLQLNLTRLNLAEPRIWTRPNPLPIRVYIYKYI